MAVPRTWAAGDVVTANGTKGLNPELRDQLNTHRAVAQVITTTGTVTSLSVPSGRGQLVNFANNASLLTIQGIPAGIDGQELTIFAIGSGRIDIAHQNGSASASDRIITPVSATIAIPATYGRVFLKYDGTAARWRVQNHTHYHLGPPEFDAGNSGTAITLDFTANGPYQKVTRNGSATVTLTAPVAPCTVLIRYVHDGTSNVYTLAYSPSVKRPGGVAPTWTNTNGAIDIDTIYWDGANWYGSQNSAFA